MIEFRLRVNPKRLRAVYYIPYMILKNQLIDKRRAKLIIEGVEVYFEMLAHSNYWVLKARIYYPLESNSQVLQDLLLSLNYVNIPQGNLRVYPEEGYVILSQDTPNLLNFASFRSTMEEFMKIHDFWKSVVDDMIKSESFLLR